MLELAEAGCAQPPARSRTRYAAGRDAPAALQAGLYVVRQGALCASSHDLHV